jgi:O-antigen/teichoic acid export membrane protein
MNQLRVGAALSYFNLVAQNLLNLAFTPLMLRSLGQEGYGLYALIGAFVAYMGVLDFGLGNAIVRYVAKFRAQGDAIAEGALLVMSLRVYGAIAAITLGLGALLLPNLEWFFSETMSPAELSEARVLFSLMTLNLALSFPLGAFQAVVSGHERFVFLRVSALVRVLLRTALLVTLLLLGYRAIAIVILDTSLNVAAGLLSVWYVRFVLRVRRGSYRFEPGFVREIVFYSAFVFVNLIVDQLFWRIGHVVLGATVGTASVAVFAIAMQIANYYKQFPLAVSSVFLPRVTAMVVSGASPDELLGVFVRTARIQLVVLLYLLGGFVLYGREFVNLWAGPSYDLAWLVAVIVMVPLTVPLAQTVGLYVLQAKNMHGFRSILYLVIAVANVLASIPLVRRWGVAGAAAGTAGALVIGHVVVMNLYYHHRVRLDVLRFLRQVSAGLVPAALGAMAAGWLLTLIPGHSWPKLVLRAVTFTALYGGAMLWLGLNSYERTLIRSPFGARVAGPQGTPVADADGVSTGTVP